MLDIYGYLASWAIYLAAGTLCYVLFYRATRWIRPRLIANLLRAIMIALIYTPWTVATDQDLMAPAVIIVPLDMITVGPDAFVRALVPLVLAILLAVAVTIGISLFGRRS
ncbi:MAG: hypothetical protein WEB57_05110 [Pseudohongiellaceae bacterium]